MDKDNKGPSFSFLDFVIKILQKRLLIILCTLIGSVLALIYAYTATPLFITYSSVKMPAQQGTNVSALLKSSGVTAGLGALSDFITPGGSSDLDYLVAIMKSRTVVDSMLDKFDMANKLKIYNREDLREVFKNDIVIAPDYQSQLLYVGVYDTNPQVAAEKTNYYVYLLNKVYTELNSQAAKNNRENLEKRYSEISAKLKQFEDSLKNYQQKYGVYSFEAQTAQGIKLAAEIKSKMALKEIEIDLQSKVKGNDAPEISLLKSELNGLKKNYDELSKGDGNKNEILLPFEKTPQLGLNYYRIFIYVTIQNELAKVLLPLLEQARFQEQRETPNIIVLDKGIVPVKKDKPQRKLIVIVGFFGGLGLGLLLALLNIQVDSIARNKPEEYKKLLRIRSLLKLWKKDVDIEV
jgi:uncharacterized protein involved in exopolysaccharide biosynthesis